MARDNEPGQPKRGKVTSGHGGIRSKYRNNVTDSAANWSYADASELLEAVHACTEAGDAIMFAKSRDGGVLVVTLYSGDERIKFYWSNQLEVSAGLQRITNDAGTAQEPA
jgi:hypothetical protein